MWRNRFWACLLVSNVTHSNITQDERKKNDTDAIDYLRGLPGPLTGRLIAVPFLLSA